MRKHFIIALVFIFTLSLAACNKAETPTETSSVLPTQKTEIIEKTLTQITTSDPAIREESTTQFVISTEEKEENNSTCITDVEQVFMYNLSEQTICTPKVVKRQAVRGDHKTF